jgi:hypothetical protein
MTVMFIRTDHDTPIVATTSANYKEARELVNGLNGMPHIRLAWVSYHNGTPLVDSHENG